MEEGKVKMPEPRVPCSKCLEVRTMLPDGDYARSWVYCEERQSGAVLYNTGASIEWRVYSPITKEKFLQYIDGIKDFYQAVEAERTKQEEGLGKLLESMPSDKIGQA